MTRTSSTACDNPGWRERMKAWRCIAIGLCLVLSGVVAWPADPRMGGYAALEFRGFPAEPLDRRQSYAEPSFQLQPEFRLDWDQPLLGVTFTPFFRYDYRDSERTHADIRELGLSWRHGNWDTRFGVSKVFWGSLEAVHLVDVINQSDLVENPDGEEKLGQPMLNVSYQSEIGRWSFFCLPYFRERTFPGKDGRLRLHPRVVNDDPVFESSLEEWHPDFSLRWGHSIQSLDLGVYYFRGTTREPAYQLAFSGAEPVLRPVYDIVHQAGLDLQWAVSDWLWKGEVMFRSGQDRDFSRVGFGFEYTFHGVFGTAADLGYINEFYYDSMGNNLLNPYERDLATGVRLAFNDLKSTTLLTAILTDVVDGSSVLTFEATRRLKQNWVLRLEAAAFISIPRDDYPLNSFRRDHYVQLGLEYHF